MDYHAETWFERDRQWVALYDEDDNLIFELWDDAVSEAVDDGFLRVPRHPRPRDNDWLPSLLAYARDAGLIEEE